MKQSTQKRRSPFASLTAALLCVLLLCALVPVTALAEGTEPPSVSTQGVEDGAGAAPVASGGTEGNASETSVVSAPAGAAAQSGEAGAGESTQTTPTETVEWTAPQGEATLAEVNKGEENTLGTPEQFENDKPSITVTESYQDKDLNKKPERVEAVLTEGGGQLAQEDIPQNPTGKTSELTQNEADGTYSRTVVTESENAIQKAINKAFESLTADTTSLTVTVGAGEYQGGLNISQADAQAKAIANGVNNEALNAGKLVLYILAEDSYEKNADGSIDKETVSADSEGKATLTGDVNVSGISLVLAGLVMLGGAINTNGNLNLYGSASGESYSIVATNSDTQLDTQSGQGGVIRIQTGAGDDTVLVAAQGSYEILADLGSGDNKLEYTTCVSENYVNQLNVATGDGNNSVQLNHSFGTLKAQVQTGTGADRIVLLGGIKANRENSTLSVNAGGGQDLICLDTSLADALKTVALNAGAGQDTLNLTGALYSGSLTEGSNLNGSATGLTLVNGNQNTIRLDIENRSVEVFTDSLTNKQSENITDLAAVTPSSFKNYVYTGPMDKALTASWENQDLFLTNLLIQGGNGNVELGNMVLPGVNLVVDGKTVKVSGKVEAGSVTIQASDSDTHGTTVPVAGEISGSLFDFNSAASITVTDQASITATTGGVNLTAQSRQDRALIDLIPGLTETTNFINVKIGAAKAFVYGAITALMGSISIVANAVSNLDVSNEKLAALFVPLAVGVAITEAIVDIRNAKLTAGGDITAQADSQMNVNAAATTGKLPVSFAVAVGVNESRVTVGGTSRLEASGNVNLLSNATANVSAAASKGDMSGNSGGFVAVDAAVQNCAAQVQDQATIQAGGDVNILATAPFRGTANAITSGNADGEDPAQADSVAGAASSVKDLLGVVVDVVKGQAMDFLSTTALGRLLGIQQSIGGKDYSITPQATKNGSVTAPSSANAFELCLETTFEDGKTYYINKGGKFTPMTADQIPADKKIPTDQRIYTKAEQVTFQVKANKGYTVDSVIVKYLPELSQTYTQITPQVQSVSEDGTVTYSFEMPTRNVTILATFKEGTAATGTGETPEQGSDAGIGDLFDDATQGTQDTGDNTQHQSENGKPTAGGIEIEIELTDNGDISAYSKTEDTTLSQDKTYYTKEGTIYKMVTAPTQDKLADYFELRGTLAVDLAKANSGDTLYAEPGKYFVLTVNPASHYALVTNSLTASYDISYRAVQEAKFGSGKYYTYDAQSDTFREATVEQGAAIPEDMTYYKETSERVTEQITPSDTGVYMVRVPVTAARGGAKVITLNAGFALENSTTVPTDRTSTPQNQGSAASSQLAGALAVGVNINDNDASVTTTGTVTAGGTVTVKAEGSCASVVKADGSPVEKPEEPTPGPETGGQEIPETTSEQYLAEYTVYIKPSVGQALTLDETRSDAAKGLFVLKVASATAFPYTPNGVQFTYVDATGSSVTTAAAFDSATKTYKVDLSSLGIQRGSQVNIDFAAPAASGAAIEGEYLVSNTLVIDGTRNGTIRHLSGKPGSGVFAFAITPREGYQYDTQTPAWVRYTKQGAAGGPNTLETVQLQSDQKGNYYLKLAQLDGLVAGTVIRIGASFAVNEKTVTTKMQKDGTVDAAVGTVTVTDLPNTNLMQVGKEVTVTVTAADESYTSVDVTLRYRPAGALQDTVETITLNGDFTGTFKMPDADVMLIANFHAKQHTVAVELGSDSTAQNATASDIQASVNAGAVGDTVVISMTDTGSQAGRKIQNVVIKVTGTGFTGQLEATASQAGSYEFIIPETLNGKDLRSESVTFTAFVTLADKAAQIAVADTYRNGGISVESSRADAGEEVVITAAPNDGYKVKNGSVKLELTSGTSTTILTAMKNAAGKYVAKLPATLAAGTVIAVKAEFTPGVSSLQPAPGSSAVSVGAAVGVNVAKHSNSAVVRNAIIRADGLELAADSSEVQAVVSAASGYSDASIGVGGAVTVLVGSAKTLALVENNADLTLGSGGLNISAAADTSFENEADGSAKGQGSSLGVGASIAVSVTGVDTLAWVEDGVAIKSLTPDGIGSVNIEANTVESSLVSARAGSAGGISVTPVLALGVSGARTEARLGHHPIALRANKDISIRAESNLTRKMAADASAAGGSVGVGGSFVISVLNDSTVSRLNRSASGRNVSVTTFARNHLSAESNAGANGAASSDNAQSPAPEASSEEEAGDSDGESDRQAANALSGAQRLSGSVGTSNTAPASLGAAASRRTGAATTEGSIQVAAAFVLNIQSIHASAEITDDLTVEAIAQDGESGHLTVESLAQNTGKLRANGSASQGRIGVGVAVALNIVEYTNKALLGNSEIKASHLKVYAGIPEEEKKSSQETVDKNQVGWLEELVRKTVTEQVEEVVKALGLSDLLTPEQIGTVTGQIVDATLKALLEGTGLEQLAQNNPYDTLKENLTGLMAQFMAIPDSLKKLVNDLMGGDVQADTAAQTWQNIRGELVNYLKTEGWKSIAGILESRIVDVTKPLLEEVLKNKDTSGLTTQRFSQAIKTALVGENGILLGAADLVVQKLAEIINRGLQTVPGIDDLVLPQDIAGLRATNLHTVVTENLGHLAGNLSQELTRGLCDAEKLMAFVKGLNGTVVKEKVESALSAAGKALTNAALDTFTELLDVKLQATSREPGHSFTTEAISGASAQKVSVAGSVALAILKGETAAIVAASEENNPKVLAVTQDALIRALGNQYEKTVATAAENSKGEADANMGAGSNDPNAAAGSGIGETPTASQGVFKAYAGENGKVEFDAIPDATKETTENGITTKVESYLVTITPNTGYQTQDGLSLTYRDASGAAQTLALQYQKDDIYFDNQYGCYGLILQYVTTTQNGETTYCVNVILDKDLAGVTKKLDVSAESPVELRADFMGSLKVTVNGTNNADDFTTQKADGKYTNTYSIKNGTTLQGKVKLVEMDGSLSSITNKATLYGAARDRLAVIVKAENGFVLDTLKFVTGTKETPITVKDLSIVDAEGGTAYLFYMPDGDTDIQVTFRAASPSDSAQTPPVTNAAGKSVGVGAGFAMTSTTVEVVAGIGDNRVVRAGSLDVRADAIRDTQTAGVAGTDPLATASQGKQQHTSKDVALDAAVALNITNDVIRSYIGKNTRITTAGDNNVQVSVDGTEDYVNVQISASRTGTTATKSSAFAAGTSTAVGASAAINIVNARVENAMLGQIQSDGDVYIGTFTFNRDNSEALATAMGADMDRYLNKVAKGVESTETSANKLMAGDYFSNDTGSKPQNQTQQNANAALDQNANGGQTSANASLSSNALRTQNAQGADSSAASGTANNGVGQANSTGAQKLPNVNPTGAQKFQVAAAVGLNITNHKATTTVAGNVSGANVRIFSTNHGNFKTLGTGMAMSQARNANSIAAAVAISVDGNEAITLVSGDITAKKTEKSGTTLGDVQFESDLTQNMDGAYKGLLAAQALAGAVSGAGKVSIAGSLAIVVDNAKSKVIVAMLDGNGNDIATKSNNIRIEGGNIRISASDKTKLAIRAGGVSLSKGSKAGVGAAFGLVYGNDQVTVQIGNYTDIRGESLEITANKLRVDRSDFESAIQAGTFITDTSKLTDEEKANAKTGFINLDKRGEDGSYTLDVNVSTSDALSLVNALNVFSSANYYVDAVAGSIMSSPASATGTSSASVAGSVAMIFFKNQVLAQLGRGVCVTLTGDKSQNPGMTLEAKDDANVRVLAGSLSAAPSKAGVGVTVGCVSNQDVVEASLGDDCVILVQKGGYNQTASGAFDVMVVTVAASASTGTAPANLSVGGTVNVIANNNTVSSLVGNNCSIEAQDTLTVTSQVDTDELLVTLSASGGNAKVAAGGTVAIIVDQAKVLTQIGASTLTSTQGGMDITSRNRERLINVAASASAAMAAGGSASAAGVVGVLVSETEAKVLVASGARLTAQKDVNILASANSLLAEVALSVAVAPSATAVGGEVLVNVLNHKAIVELGSAAVESLGGNVTVHSSGEDTAVIVGVAVGASGTGNTVSGTIPVTVSTNAIETRVGAGSQITALDSVDISADLQALYALAAGGISVGTTGVGATVGTLVLSNSVLTTVETGSRITAKTYDSGSNILQNRYNRRRGVNISANARETVVMAEVSAAAGTGNAITGTVATLVVSNKVKAEIGDAVTVTVGVEGDKDSEEGDLSVDASDDTFVVEFAGALSAAGSVGVGATVVVGVFDKNVKASVGNSGSVNASGTVSVTAENKSTLDLLAVAFGASGSTAVAGDVNALVFMNSTQASLGGNVTGANAIRVRANDDSKLLNIGIGVAASGAAAVTAVAVVTYFENKTLAQVLDKALLQAGNGGVEVIAVSREFVSGDAAGTSGGGTAGVGGTLDVVVLRFRTEALTGSNVTIRTTGDLTVRAEDNYGLVAAVVTLAASGTAAVGVNALVSVSFATVRAAIGVENTVEARNVTVQGSSQRDLLSVSASVAGSGVAAVGVNLSVVVAGALMSRDAHDSLYGTVENGGSTYTLYTFTPKGSGSVTLYEQGGSFYKAKTDSQGKEQRDSNNQLILEAFTVSEEDRKYLAPAAMNPETQVSGAFAAGNGQYLQGRDPSQKVGQSLQGDGQKLGTEDYGNYGQESTDTAPVKGDGKLYIKNSDGTYTAITDEEASTTYRNTQRYLYDTRNSTYVETDLTSANTFNDSTFAATGGTGYTVQKLPQLSDATSAIIGGNSLVTAAENIRVLASDNLNANMISGSIAVGGGGAGVGVGLTVSVLSSNVNALVDTGAVLSAGGNIEVKSWVGAKAQSVKTHSDRNNRVSNSGTNEQMDALGIPTQENSTIRLISVTAGGGFVGVGVSGAVLVVTSESNAILRGSVAKAANLYVESCMNFGDVLTVNTGISAGAVAVNVSIGATYFQGSSVAAIDGNGRIENISGTIRVCNSGTTNSQVAVAALAAGGVAVNAGIATAINLTKVRTYVGKNVTVSAPNALLVVSHDFTANAQGGILSISAGAVATGACVVVVVNKLDARAYVGFAPDETVTGESGSIQVRSITVTAEAAGKTEVLGAGIAGGAIAGNGIVAVGLGFITNIGAIRGVDITTGDLTVKAAIDGDVHVVSTGVTGGAVAVGATVDVAYIGSVNKAILDLTGAKVKVTGGVRVQAGSQDKPNDSYSRIIAVTGSAGSAAMGINLALAFNKAVNNAELLGLTGSMEAESLGVLAYGSAKAHTLVVNAALGGVTASATLAFAWVGSQQQARLDTAENLTVQKDVLVSSVLSAVSEENLTAEQKGDKDYTTTVPFTKVAESRIYTASAGMVTATGNGAVALSDGTSSAWASFGGKAGKVAVSNTAASTAYAGIENFSLGGVSVGVMMGYSFASGTFEAVLNAQKALTCEDITVTNTYTSLADTNVTPASGGVSATLTNIGLNTAVACATTTANTGISGTGTLDVHGNMAVTAQGTAQANANIVTPTASFSVVAVTANVAVAVNNVRQNTFVRDCSLNTVTGDVTLVSNLNKNSQMGAKARVGASTATSGSVSYANLTANACVANFNAVHTALVSGISGTIHGTLSVMANTASLADAGVYSGSAVSYYSGTVTVVYAYAGGSSKADLYLEKNKKLRVGKLNLTNQYQTKATAESKQSDNGISVNMAAADLNVAYAEACSVACAGIEGDGSLSAEDGEGDSLIVLCQGTAAADAKILPANVSIAGVKLAANNVFSKVTAQHTAHIGSESTAPDVSSNGNISVISRFNESGDGATATVGSGNSSNVNVSLLGVTESLALAEMEAQAKAAIVNGTIRAKGNVDVQMLGRLIAKAEVYNGSTLGLYNATVMVVRANAKGSMEALLNAKTIEAATVNVKNDYYAQSEAETGFAGGLVAGIGSASSNVAYATTSSTAKAAFGAAAGGNITGSISLENLGHVSAKALGRSATVTVSGLNVAVNVINADLNAVQNTSFTYGGKLDIQGDVNIRSEILREGDFGKADAQTGSTAGASISLVGASANKATAATATRNTLTVRGVGENRMTLTGSFTARAKSVTESFAKAALPQSLGLASIGSMISDSSTRDVVSVTVTGACMEIDGTFKAESIGNTASTSEAHKAGGVGVAEATFTTSDAKVGAASDKPQTVGLTVTGGSIQALEDIILRAYNKGTAQSIVKKGTEVSGIGIAQTRLPTNSWYSTNVSVTDGAVLTAEGSITLTSEDTTEAKADATGTNIGFAINADYTKGENHITSNNTVTIGAKLQADDSLTVTADSKATMTAKTVADGGGFFTKGTLTAINELIRSCLITVAENSDLSANHGSLSICANAGENDVITTTAKITSGGVVALGNVRTELTLKTTSKVHIHDVGHIQNRFGTVTIRANASQNGVVTNSSADCSGLGVAPDVHNQAVINLESNVNIQNVKEIEGRYG